MRRFVAGIGGIGLAVVLSQFPEYAQQYTQRLGGAVDELRREVEQFDAQALAGGLTRAEALDRYSASNDEFLAGRGVSMAGTIQRFEYLSTTLEQVQGAGPIERFQQLPAYWDTDIGMRTLDNYKPAVPVTMEGIFYAGGGFILGYLLTSGVWRFLALPFRKRYPAYRRW